jgi:hypothetical protein
MKILKPENLDPKAYFTQYIELSEDGNLIDVLEVSRENLLEELIDISDAQSDYKYADGKWTIKQVVQHITDTERILSYRALRFGRNDKTEIEGFEEDEYAKYDHSDQMDFSLVLEEFAVVRLSTILLFKSIDPQFMDHKVLCNGHSLSPRMLGFIMNGHAIHHVNVIRERYMSGI